MLCEKPITLDAAEARRLLPVREQFERAARAGTPVPVPLEDSIAHMEVLDAIVRSAATGGWETP